MSPLKSDTPEFLGARWIPIRPNTDTAMMLAMAHTLLAEGRHDEAFMASYCHGFEGFRRYLLGETTASPKNADWAAAITGVPADTIRELARRAADVRSMITCAWSLQRAHHGEQPYLGDDHARGDARRHRAAGRRLRLRPRLRQRRRRCRASPCRRPRCRCRRIRRNPSIPVARIADMLLDPGGAYEFNGRHETYPDIRLVYWAGGNPFHHHQDLNRLRRAWQKPETIVVHESWWTPTARHADIVLPATTTLERNDIGGSSRDPFVFAMHRAIDPVREARNDFDIFRALARRLGYEQAFTEGRDEMGWVQWVYDDMRAAAEKQGVPLPGFQQFWAEGFVEMPPPSATSCCSRTSAPIPTSIRSRRRRGAIEIVLRDHRALRLRRLPAASDLVRAGRMARQRRRPSAVRSIS